jgi:hypothetical protein
MRLLELLRRMPGSAMLPVEWIVSQLEQEPVPVSDVEASPPEPVPDTWRERVWLVPAQTRLGVQEVAEAIGRPVSFVYRRTSAKAAARGGYDLLPHRRLDGELIFTAGEIRAWLEDHEEVVRGGRMVSGPSERTGLRIEPNRAA